MSALPADPRRQWRVVAILLAAIAAVLLAAYYAFLRTPMTPAFQNIREADAAAIVTQLDKANIPYRLTNDGHDVLVPDDRTADARVAVAGAHLALGDTMGFELFDNSDMGLTEFAQKINFQRAMQGELARTIMAMQGVEFARVHLALPERSIFRTGQGAPTAAVTIKMTTGFTLTSERIDGIRQLIASSVPGLSPAAVAVLDESGDLVSPVAIAGGAPADEGTALGSYYQLKAREAIARAVPDVPVDVIVAVRRQGAAAGVPIAADRSLPDRDAVTLAIVVRTATPATIDVQERIIAALAEAQLLRRDAGDGLRFIVGTVGLDVVPPATTTTPRVDRPLAAPNPVAAVDPVPAIGWPLVAAVGLGLVGIAWLASRRRRLADNDALSFAEQLKAYAPERTVADAV